MRPRMFPRQSRTQSRGQEPAYLSKGIRPVATTPESLTVSLTMSLIITFATMLIVSVIGTMVVVLVAALIVLSRVGLAGTRRSGLGPVRLSRRRRLTWSGRRTRLTHSV